MEVDEGLRYVLVGQAVCCCLIIKDLPHFRLNNNTVKEENHVGRMLCILSLNTPPIHIVQILIVRLIHCYDVLIFIIIFLGTGTT